MSERLTITQLRCFVAVAATLSFRQAAEDLHMTQPPLTRQIQALERAVGAQLLERSHKRVALTSAGHVLCADAQRILKEISHIRSRVRDAAATGKKSLAVSYLESCEPDIVPESLRHFTAAHPDVHVHLEVHGSFEAEDRLVQGDVDVAFLRPPARSPEVALTMVRLEPLVAVLPLDHPLAGKEIDLIQLKDEEFIGYSRTMDVGIRSAVVHACATAGFIPRYTSKTTSSPMLISMIAAGKGVTLFSSAWARVARSGVAYSPIRDASATTMLAIGVVRDRSSSLTRAFIDAALQAARRLGGPSPRSDSGDE